MMTETENKEIRRRRLTDEELEAWKQDILSLNIPELLASSNRKLNQLPEYGMHLYVRQDFIRSVSQWKTLRQHKKYVSHVFLNGQESNYAASTFVHTLSKYELDRFEARNKKKNFNPNAHSETCQPIILNTFKFCLPQQMTEPSQFQDFAVAMAQKIAVSGGNALPFFYMVAVRTVHDPDNAEGSTHVVRYLWLCTTERFWYPTGLTVDKKYNRDYYYIPAAGRTSSTPVEGAVLKHKKGEVYGQETIYFSLKTRVFSCAGKQAWQGLLKKVRGAMLSYFKDHHYGNSGCMMPRLGYDHYRVGSRKRTACRTVNLFMSHLEKKADSMIDGFYAMNIESSLHKFFSIFHDARQRLVETMQKGSYRQAGRSWKLDFNALISNDMLCLNLEVVGDRFIQSIWDSLAPIFAAA